MKRKLLFRPKRTTVSSALEWGAIAILGVGVIGSIGLHIDALRDPLTMPKTMLVMVCAVIAALLFGTRLLVSKKIDIHRYPVDAGILAFTVIALCSWIFASNSKHAVLGQPEVFGISLLASVGAIGFAYISAQYAQRSHILHGFIMLQVVLAGVISTGFMLVTYAPGVFVNIPFLHMFLINPVTTFASVFGMYAAVMLLLTLSAALHRTMTWWGRLLCVCAIVVHWIVIMGIALPQLYILLAIGVSVVIISSWQLEQVVQWVRALGVLLIAMAIGFSFAGTPSMLKGELPAELTLGSGVSTQITQKVLMKDVPSFFLGNGPASFGFAFMLHRPPAFNALEAFSDKTFWQPYSTVHAVFAEYGFLGALAMLFIVLLGFGVLFTGISAMNHVGAFSRVSQTRPHVHPDQLHGVGLGAAWIILSIACVFSFIDAALWILWWWVLLMMCAAFAIQTPRLKRVKTVAVQSEVKDSFFVSFLFVSLVTAVGISTAFGARHIIAEKYATAGLQSSTVPIMIDNFTRATQLRPAYGPYHELLAESYLQYARTLSKKSTVTDEFTLAMANAVDQAKLATVESPQLFSSWETLATMYNNARLFTSGADGYTLKSLDEAIALSPTNAQLYWRKALIHIEAEQDAEAKNMLEKAIQLHPKFVSAHAALGDIFERSEQFDEAVQEYEKTLEIVPDNIDMQYQYARVLYNRGSKEDLQKAVQTWLDIVKIHPDHSNSLFSLGIAAERFGQKEKAIEFYSQVLSLNPENEEVKKKILSLN